MKSLILEYAERPTAKEIDNSMIEYSRKHNLSVLKGTDKPAIQAAYLDTETMTKADGEPSSDTDNDVLMNLKTLLDTSVETKSHGEVSIPDNTEYQVLRNLMDTQTLTEAREETDSDK
jgi:hypothetical protein